MYYSTVRVEHTTRFKHRLLNGSIQPVDTGCHTSICTLPVHTSYSQRVSQDSLTPRERRRRGVSASRVHVRPLFALGHKSRPVKFLPDAH